MANFQEFLEKKQYLMNTLYLLSMKNGISIINNERKALLMAIRIIRAFMDSRLSNNFDLDIGNCITFCDFAYFFLRIGNCSNLPEGLVDVPANRQVVDRNLPQLAGAVDDEEAAKA